MKYASIIVAVIAIALAAWLFLRDGSPEPAIEATAPEAVVEAVEQPEAVADDSDEPEESVLVEESTGEPEAEDEGERPLILAQADTSEAAADRDWQFSEGTHYTRMVPAQPTVGGADKIEIAEFFWYGCNHCFDFEPYINQWKKTLPANVRFVRIHPLWNPLVRIHGQIFYTEEVLAANGILKDQDGFRQTVFLEIHRRGNRLSSESAIQAVFERFDVSPEDFKSAWNSFEVSQKMRVAEDLSRRYGITSVPLMVVNGKYRTGAAEAGSYPRLLEMMDELVEREEAIR